jgi:hypothetical protein
MIRKEIIDDNDGHIIVYADEPVRFEIIKYGGRFILHGYKGTKINMEQKPIIFHDTNYTEADIEPD